MLNIPNIASEALTTKSQRSNAMNIRLVFILILPLIFLGACTMTRSDLSTTENGNSKDILSGQWRDKAGMMSSFNHGSFETRTPDTNEKLAEGSYNRTDNRAEDKEVNIEVKSLVKGNVSKVLCRLGRFNNTLYCTATGEGSDNIAFKLVRVN